MAEVGIEWKSVEEERHKMQRVLKRQKALGLVYNLKMENKNLTREIVELNDKLSNLKLPVKPSSARDLGTQTDSNTFVKKVATQTPKTMTIVTDSCTQTQNLSKITGKTKPTAIRDNKNTIVKEITAGSCLESHCVKTVTTTKKINAKTLNKSLFEELQEINYKSQHINTDNQVHNKIKHKILLLADNHGRNLSKMLVNSPLNTFAAAPK
ncbi:hypothetical protein FQR65_LT13912 [Abscondita terminalis]|nr:hypothetical protein FQR65_LT13912 [Abscondita terminalis]